MPDEYVLIGASMNSPMSAKSTMPGQSLLHVPMRDAEERAGEPDVVAARQVGVEARAERQQARDVADDVDRALVRLDDPGEDLEQRALAGAVRADDGEALAVDDAGTRRRGAPRSGSGPRAASGGS